MKTTKTVIPIVFAVLGLALLSACGNNDNVCDDAFCIGTLFPTVDDPSWAMPLSRAAREAENDINAAGIDEFFGNVALLDGREGVQGKTPVEATLDSARGLVARGARGLIGPTYSSSFELPYASRNYGNFFDFLTRERIVTVSPTASSSSLADRNMMAGSGNRFFFRTVPSNDLWAKIIAGEVGTSTRKVLIVYRDDAFGVDLKNGIQSEMRKRARAPEVQTVAYEPYGEDQPYGTDGTGTNAEARAVVEDVEAVSGLADVDFIIMIVFDEGGKIINEMLKSDAVPDDAKYHVAGLGGEGLENFAKLVSPEDPAAVDGFVVSSPEEGYGDEAYDAVVVMALAALAAKSTDPEEYVSQMANVTKEGTLCTSYAQCAGLLTDDDASNDDINYCGRTGRIELKENGDPAIGYFVVKTYDSTGMVVEPSRTLDNELNEADVAAKCPRQ